MSNIRFSPSLTLLLSPPGFNESVLRLSVFDNMTTHVHESKTYAKDIYPMSEITSHAVC